MNKTQLRKIVEGSIQYADEQDAADQGRRRTSGLDRKCDRLNYFLIALQAELSIDDPEVRALINGFQKRVISGENALLDTGANKAGGEK